MKQPFESEYLYGFHDPGGEHLMAEHGVQGWILFTEAIGHNPDDVSGRSYEQWSGRGFGIIVRLNNGYSPSGTIPRSDQYANFAQRCANFASASTGAHIWIIGNETNYSIERPEGEVITPEMYATCYGFCRDAIRAARSDDMVLVGAVAPWNAETQYPGNGNGDWVQYFADILTALGRGGCDGFTLHAYTHGANPALVYGETKMNAPFQDRHFDFRAYQDFMNAVPQDMRDLPCYITEADQDVSWLNRNTGWVQRAYGEIDYWNKQAGNQQIRALLLYRWPNVPGDKWGIDGLAGVHEDFVQAVKQRYRWTATDSPPKEEATMLKDALLAQAELEQVIRFNPKAALQRAIFVDGFVPNSAEFTVDEDGISYVAQRAEHMGTGEVRVYYVPVGDWGNVQFVSDQVGIRIALPFAGDFRISQGWGENPEWYDKYSYGGVALKGHNGIDFATPMGTPILAVDAGIVIKAAYDAGGFGDFVEVEHAWGMSLYAHLSDIDVYVGGKVRQGERLGLSGSTGNSTGPHLHFSVRVKTYRADDGWGGFSNAEPYFT